MANVLVSACLVGSPSRYDGSSRLDRGLLRRLRSAGCTIIPVCPEQLGGLPTPRPPAEIDRGDGHAVLAGDARLINAAGDDVTVHYRRGARETLRLARLLHCRTAYLKEKSPACGVRWIKRGDATVPGRGVAAALLESAAIEIVGV